MAHELVGQAHAVLTIARREDVLPAWCPDELRQAVRNSAPEVDHATGRLHAAIATGQHDTNLRAAGIGGPAGRPKRKGFRRALEGLSRIVGAADQMGQNAAEALHGRPAKVTRAWLKSAAGWGKLAIDSIASEIPGGQLIKEALEVITVGVDTLEAEEITNSSDDADTT